MRNLRARDNASITWVIIAALILLLMVAAVAMIGLTTVKEPNNEIIIGLIIVLGLSILMVLLLLATVAFQRLGLADHDQALGLPEGSVRALIAIMLILVFIICGLYLFRSVAFPTGTMSEDGARLAQQLITTIGTLVVAVAGFYFGTSAVKTASSAVTPTIPLIRGIEPETGAVGTDVQLMIQGRNFRMPKTVRLTHGGSEIVAENVLASDMTIQCTIKIPPDSKADTRWDLEVVNEDGQKDTLTGAFTVVTPAPPPQRPTPQ